MDIPWSGPDEDFVAAKKRSVRDRWGNAVSGLLFTVGACYFVNISYPEEMERCAREALTVDVSTLTFMERTFTFNDMLLATWSFELGCVPYVVIALAYLCDSDEAWLGGPRRRAGRAIAATPRAGDV